MGILVQFLQDMRHWDPPVRWGFGLGVVLLVALLLVMVAGRDQLPSWSAVGVVVLGLVLQGLALYGNRHLVTPYTQAQRAFRAGDFDQARAILERHIQAHAAANKLVSADVYVLLGNTLRNLGLLDESEHVLRRVVEQQPEYGFALYGLGRTLLAQGNFAKAAAMIKESIRFGAPQAVSFEMGYATLEAGDVATGREMLYEALAHATEPYRQLMAYHLLGKLEALAEPSLCSLAVGLAYWEREAEVFAHTPYGARVAEHVKAMRQALDHV